MSPNNPATTAPPPAASTASQHGRRNDESWVEIASQPSSSSLSSVADEIITTGLRVGGSLPARRRRPQHHQQHLQRASFAAVHHAATPGNTSSQEEYDETESEEDRLMTSSAENITSPRRPSRASLAPPRVGPASDTEEEEEDDDDENATALGYASNQRSFRPQPNAFSHPPGQLSHRSHSTNSSMPPHPHGSLARPMLPERSHTRLHRGPPNFMSPSYQADNDAALRASLTTLLSCAAAARGLPEKETQGAAAGQSGVRPGVGPSNQPMELLFVPESDLLAGPRPSAPASEQQQQQPISRPRSPSSTSSRSAAAAKDASMATLDKGKRTAPAAPSRSTRAAKKKKTVAVAAASEDALISPTLLTWVVSAGVLVLVSVVGFGAGYVIGREVGRQEALAAGAGFNASSVADTGSCGREVMRSSGGSLRRFRWGASMAKSVAAS